MLLINQEHQHYHCDFFNGRNIYMLEFSIITKLVYIIHHNYCDHALRSNCRISNYEFLLLVQVTKQCENRCKLFLEQKNLSFEKIPICSEAVPDRHKKLKDNLMAMKFAIFVELQKL